MGFEQPYFHLNTGPCGPYFDTLFKIWTENGQIFEIQTIMSWIVDLLKSVFQRSSINILIINISLSCQACFFLFSGCFYLITVGIWICIQIMGLCLLVKLFAIQKLWYQGMWYSD